LSLRGTNEISGRYLRAEILSVFFENFLDDREPGKLRGNIIFFSFGAREPKLGPNKIKTREKGQQKKLAEI
jgi:hypothetical protein